MKKTINFKMLAIGLLLVPALLLAGCKDSEAPMTETQQAEKYNLSLEEFRKQKDAAASMGMTIDEHLKMSN